MTVPDVRMTFAPPQSAEFQLARIRYARAALADAEVALESASKAKAHAQKGYNDAVVALRKVLDEQIVPALPFGGGA